MLSLLGIDTFICFKAVFLFSLALTCPRGSLRNSEEVTPDLPRSETNIRVGDHRIATICNSVRLKKKKKKRAVKHTHTLTRHTRSMKGKSQMISKIIIIMIT